MKLTQIAVVAAALFGGANAAGDVAGRKDGDELGIDCGGDGQSDCTCWTDTTYGQNGFVPPTLINDNVDRSGVDSDRETGLYTDGSSNTFLEVVIDLDASVFTETATNVEGTQPVTTGAAGSYHLTSGLTTFATANAYKNPVAYFVDSSNNALGDCTFDATGASDSTEPGSANGALFIKRPTTTAAAQYGTDGDECANNQFQVHFRTDFKEMLGNCGWTSSITDGDLIDGTDTSDSSTTDEVVGNSYTRYLGRVKIETTRQMGELRGAENVLKEEYAFQITVLFPNTLTVTSSEVSVIGEATHQAQLTHQIYDSTNNNLNLNMLVGTTYPYAVSTADLTSPDYTSSLVLNATNTPFLDRPAFALVLQDLTAGSDWLTYCAAGVERGLAYANDKLCDHDGSTDVTLGDFVTVVNDGDAFYSHNADDSSYFGTLTPGGSALPTQKCTGENQSPASENDQACLQNTFMRLVPHDSYCDFNLGLKLTLNAVCRDDYNGNGDDADSIISVFGDSGTPTAVPSWPVMTSNRLFTGTARLPCDSATYRTNIDPAEALNFQLASDNFCPRVIAEASLNTPEMAIYESTFGQTTWGAHGCTDSANCLAELDAVANSAACSNGDPAVDGNACLSVPGYADDAASPTASQRKIQDEFVFGTTVYVETRVAVTSGVNIESTEITEAWIARSERPDDNVARAANEFPTGATKDTGLATNEMWQKRIINNKIAVADEQYTAAGGSTHTGADYVSLSNFVTTDDLVVRTGGNFLTTNPAGVGTEAAKLGEEFEGVSRFTVQMNEFTVLITDTLLGEAAEPIAFYANIDIKYKNANEQGQLGTTKTSQKVPSGMANRARSLAAPAVTGGQASAQAGIRPAGTTGAAGSSSTIAGFSSTTVLAAAAVLGAVVVAAGASFFVVRKRRAAAAKTAKRSSSSTELNDTAQVQV